MIPMAHQLVGDYLIIDEDEENSKHMIMRPDQVYALQAVELAAFGLDNEDKIPHGGYVWHTTEERVIIVIGCINALVSRASGTIIKS